MTFGVFQRKEILKEQGIMSARYVIDVNNIASQRIHTKFNPKIYAKANYLRVLGWKFWKETPLYVG